MRYVQAGFVGEGPSDFDFLKPLARRALEDLLFARCPDECEIPDLVDVRPGGRAGNTPAAVVGLVQSDYGYLDYLFYHADANGNVDRAYDCQVRPVREGLAGVVRTIPVVPRREMEAWVLADSAALGAVLGLAPGKHKTPDDFKPGRVESLLDPKSALKSYLDGLPVRRFRAVDPAASLLASVSAVQDLSVLRKVPQFKRFDDDLNAALIEDGIISGSAL